MARYEPVEPAIWNDRWFRSLEDHDAGKAWLYLLTNPHKRPSGMYDLPLDVWAADVRVTTERIEHIKRSFVRADKIRYDDDAGVLWVVKAWHKNTNKNVPKVIDAALADMERHHRCVFFKEFCKAYPSLTEAFRQARESLNRIGCMVSRPGEEVQEERVIGSQAKAWLDGWCKAFQAVRGSAYVVSGAKEMVLVKRGIRTLGAQELARRAMLFLESRDPFIQRAGYTIGVFFSQVNKFAVSSNGSGVDAWMAAQEAHAPSG